MQCPPGNFLDEVDVDREKVDDILGVHNDGECLHCYKKKLTCMLTHLNNKRLPAPCRFLNGMRSPE